MRLYESVVIVNPHMSDEQARGCMAKIGDILTKHSAKLVHKVEWGRRPLGFRINKQNEGVFWLLDIEADPSRIGEIHSAFRLADFILFSSIFVKEKTGLPAQKTAA